MSEVAARYLNNAYLLKLRLLHARKLLERESNLFHFEEACLAIRKIVESISFFCLLSAEIHFGRVPRQIARHWNAEEIFGFLERKKLLRFPHLVRVTLQGGLNNAGPNRWLLDMHQGTASELERVRKIYEQTQKFLHEFNPYNSLPFHEPEFEKVIRDNMRKLAGDHLWIWNRFWQHGTLLQERPFVCTLEEPRSDIRPRLIAQESFEIDKFNDASWILEAICTSVSFTADLQAAAPATDITPTVAG